MGLTSLGLGSNFLKNEGITIIADALLSNKGLKLSSLDFSNNGIGPIGAKSVAAMLAVMSSLTQLDLSKNQLCGVDEYKRGTYCADGIKAIADALGISTSLTKLDLSCNMLCGVDEEGDGEYDTTAIKAIAEALGISASLTSCNVLFNRMNVATAKLLVEGVKDKDISLCGIKSDQTTCDLNGSDKYSFEKLGPPDAILLASDLSKVGVSASLTSLGLGYNQLQDEGVTSICDAVQSNKQLKLASLDFEYNKITVV